MLLKTLCMLGLVLSVTAYAADVKPDADAIANEAKNQIEFTLKAYTSDYNRLEQITYPLLRVGAPYCSDKRRWSLGALPRSSLQLSDELKPAAGSVGLDTFLTFVTVLEATPAATAGILVGDKLLAINNEEAPKDKENLQWYLKTIHTLGQKNASISLTLMRSGQTIVVSLKPHHICNVGMRYILSDAVNAYASVTDLMVTGGMLRFVEDDDELALVLGHELAHAILRHPEEKQNDMRNRTAAGILTILFGRGAFIPPPARDPYSHEKELDSDYLGIYLAAAAGHDTSKVADFWRRMAARNPGNIKESHTSSHPSTPERYLRLQAAAAEISTKQQTGQRLMPNLALLKTSYDGDFVVYEGRKKVIRRVAKTSVEEGKNLPNFTEVPFLTDNGRVLYQRFLSIKTRPRAFALSASGRASSRTGANAAADALESCNLLTQAKDCALYVVNDEFVFDSKKLVTTPVVAPVSKELKPDGLNTLFRAKYPPSNFADAANLSAVPHVGSECRTRYSEFLSKPSPKGFAINPTGHCGFSWGTKPPKPELPIDPAERALLVCDNMGRGVCKLYVLDDVVVWTP